MEKVVERNTAKEIEKSIKKKYKGELWNKFIKGIKEFQLIEEGDRIAVTISGGKDSLLMAKMLQMLSKNRAYNFEVVFVSMNPGFSRENLDNMKENLETLGIEAHIFDTDVFEVSTLVSEEAPCYMCARMRRGALYSKAKELGCNKMALGHHFDDVVETIMLSMLYTGRYQTMMPKLRADNFEDMEIIRPMYFIEEKDIIEYTKENEIEAMNCGCAVTSGKVTPSKRAQVKEVLKNLSSIDSEFKWRIYKSSTNVNLEKVISYYAGDKVSNFLDKY